MSILTADRGTLVHYVIFDTYKECTEHESGRLVDMLNLLVNGVRWYSFLDTSSVYYSRGKGWS